MSLYTIMLFFHVSGDIGLFIGIGVQLLGLLALRQARSVDQVRAILRLVTIANPIGVASALLTITTGLYMASTTWNLRIGWIAVAFGSIIVLLPPLIGGIIEPRMKRIVEMARKAPDGAVSEPLHNSIHDSILMMALQTVAAIVLGIVFLMTTKPVLVGALIVMAVAVTLGLASALPAWVVQSKQRSEAGNDG
ncbi:MAG: hypothetical protein L0332_30555 [Chloroflexi bacterium]|nr:hypothetical protein [Chloroflexota bacterium]MCI0577781.1 hypothetical protein [Chloroflexota bacterium]MCI0643413.1 hypothetical protein [Chloroflexota bacterium]MCI0731041.1 hypothetical protein [Chloroflexota bacterium]